MSIININLQLDRESINHLIDAFKSISFAENFVPKDLCEKESKTYTCEEASSVLKIDKVTVQRYCNSGLIKASKIGKTWVIKQSEINRFLEHK